MNPQNINDKATGSSTNSNIFPPPNFNPFAPNNQQHNAYIQGASFNWADGALPLESLDNCDHIDNTIHAKHPEIGIMARQLSFLEHQQTRQIDSSEIRSLIGEIRAKVGDLSRLLDQQDSTMKQKMNFRYQMSVFLMSPSEHIVNVYRNTRQTEAFKDLLDQTERDDVLLTNIQTNANQLIGKLTSQLSAIGRFEYKAIKLFSNTTIKSYIDIIHSTIAKVLSFLKYPSVTDTLTGQVLFQLIETQMPFKMIHHQSELPKEPFWTEPSQWFLNPSMILLQYVKIASNVAEKAPNAITRPYLLSLIRIYSNTVRGQVQRSPYFAFDEYKIAQTLALETVFYDFNLILQQIKATKTEFDTALMDSLLLELYRLCAPMKISKLSDEMILSLADLIDTMLSQFGAIDIWNYFGLVDGEIKKNEEHSRLNWFLAYIGNGIMPPNNFDGKIAESMKSAPIINEPVATTSAATAVTQSIFALRNDLENVSTEAPPLPPKPSNQLPRLPKSKSPPLQTAKVDDVDDLMKQLRALKVQLNASAKAIERMTKLLISRQYDQN